MPRCPSCFMPLTRVEEADIKSATCGNCFGTWINAMALMRRTRLDARDVTPMADQPSLAELAEIVQSSNSTDMLRCPQCEKPMLKDRFHPMIPVEVDRCRRCDYFWLDAGELKLVRQLYVELMTSDDPEIQRRRDKVALTAARVKSNSREGARDATNQGGGGGGGVRLDDAFDMLVYLIDSV